MHTIVHRMWAGLAVMLLGVFIAHFAGDVPRYMSMIVDMVGYGIHALGATPYIEWMLED